MDVLRVREASDAGNTTSSRPSCGSICTETPVPDADAEQTLLTNYISRLSSPHLHPQRFTWWVSQFSSENLFRNWRAKMWNPLKFVWAKSYKASTLKEFHNCTSEEPPRINRLDPYSRWFMLLISCCNSCMYNPKKISVLVRKYANFVTINMWKTCVNTAKSVYPKAAVKYPLVLLVNLKIVQMSHPQCKMLFLILLFLFTEPLWLCMNFLNYFFLVNIKKM